MCRMIGAVGRFDLETLKSGLRDMALNRNPAYEHEHRRRGEGLRHDCGWGAAFVTGDGLLVHRSTTACFDDASFDALACEDVRVAVLHARRNRDRGTIALENTHPFVATWRDLEHAFFHNGEVKDREQLTYERRFKPRGTADSEELFFHVLSRFDPDTPLSSLKTALSGITDFTCLNSLLVSGDRLFAYAGMAGGTPYPRYYTLWRSRTGDADVVSSEPIALEGADWKPVEDGRVLRLGD
ncbi:MAG: hypothetical protein GF400_00195 [Candidatus Eisenbacteria bacterium]|nr:hypothetical protein [Candidatus Eisenbacteria bacterium]